MMRNALFLKFGLLLLIGVRTTVISGQTAGPIRFAAIGDYGTDDRRERMVADMVKSWQPDFIITLGDNNYPNGEADTIDDNIGQYFHEFIYPYKGKYGEGATVNRFFPSLGNHDYGEADDNKAYLDYFELPGNERFYDFIWGPVHFFALNSDRREPAGITADSDQAFWLQQRLGASTTPWQLVYMHHPAFSSGQHGSDERRQWPFKAWGADALLVGHDHLYERIVIDGFPYFVNGAGGRVLYDFEEIVPGSELRFNTNFGAQLVTADACQMIFEFYSVAGGGTRVDTYKLNQCE